MNDQQGQSLISMIVPVYQAKKYLASCINAVLKQTHSCWELILVDDGSTDGSELICDDFANQDARITVVHQPNQGVSAARNRGVASAKGAYIAFLDADDLIEPDYLEVLYRDAISQNADLVCCNAWEDFQGTRTDYRCVLKNRTIEDRETLYLDALVRKEQYGFTVWGKLIKTELAVQLRFSSLHFCEDMLFMLQLFEKVSRVYLDNYTGYVYMRNPDSVTLKSGIRDVSRRMNQMVAVQYCFRQACTMSQSVQELAVQNYARNIHAAAASTVLAGSGAYHQNRKKLLEYIAELKPYDHKLHSAERVKLFLYEYVPPVYRLSIRVLQMLGRTG